MIGIDEVKISLVILTKEGNKEGRIGIGIFETIQYIHNSSQAVTQMGDVYL